MSQQPGPSVDSRLPALCAAALALSALVAVGVAALLVPAAKDADTQVLRTVATVVASLLGALALLVVGLALRTLRRGPSLPAAVGAIATGLVCAVAGSDSLRPWVPGSLALGAAVVGLLAGIAVLFLSFDPATPRSRRSLM